jgi:hypothetical protein
MNECGNSKIFPKQKLEYVPTIQGGSVTRNAAGFNRARWVLTLSYDILSANVLMWWYKGAG